MTDVQAKKDGLDLLQALADDTLRKVLLRAFETELTELGVSLLNPELTDAEALWVRAKAVGIVEVLNKLGATVQNVADLSIRRAAGRTVRQAFGQDLTG